MLSGVPVIFSVSRNPNSIFASDMLKKYHPSSFCTLQPTKRPQCTILWSQIFYVFIMHATWSTWRGWISLWVLSHNTTMYWAARRARHAKITYRTHWANKTKRVGDDDNNIPHGMTTCNILSALPETSITIDNTPKSKLMVKNWLGKVKYRQKLTFTGFLGSLTSSNTKCMYRTCSTQKYTWPIMFYVSKICNAGRYACKYPYNASTIKHNQNMYWQTI